MNLPLSKFRLACCWRLPLSTTLVLLALTGCSQKAMLQSLQPAQIQRATEMRVIAVAPFDNDQVGLSAKIESGIASIRIDNQSFYTLIARKDLQRIVDEQKLQLSGLISAESSVALGNMLGAQAIIIGEIAAAETTDTRTTETRRKCVKYDNKKCLEYGDYRVNCRVRQFVLSSNLRMVDVELGDVIHADQLTRRSDAKVCTGDRQSLPGPAEGLNGLANQISRIFVHKIAPHYANFAVELLDEPNIDYSNEQEKWLESALKYIDAKRFDRAEELLNQLFASTQQRCFVAAYNLGVVNEVRGNLQRADELYRLADRLAGEPMDAINQSINRIGQSLAAQEQVEQSLR